MTLPTACRAEFHFLCTNCNPPRLFAEKVNGKAVSICPDFVIVTQLPISPPTDCQSVQPPYESILPHECPICRRALSV